MTAWGSPHRVLAVDEAAERRDRPDDLVGEIAAALAAAGRYVARVDQQPAQRVVDVTWAARQAGRRLGMRVQVDTTSSRAAADGKAEVRVTAVAPSE